MLADSSSERTKTVRLMLFNPEDVVETPEEVYKLWPRRRDRDLWPIAMGDTVPDYHHAPTRLYLQARRYFASAAREYATIGEDKTIDPGAPRRPRRCARQPLQARGDRSGRQR